MKLKTVLNLCKGLDYDLVTSISNHIFTISGEVQQTALGVAVKSRDQSLVRHLLHCQADPFIEFNSSMGLDTSAVEIAAAPGYLDILSLLLSHAPQQPTATMPKREERILSRCLKKISISHVAFLYKHGWHANFFNSSLVHPTWASLLGTAVDPCVHYDHTGKCYTSNALKKLISDTILRDTDEHLSYLLTDADHMRFFQTKDWYQTFLVVAIKYDRPRCLSVLLNKGAVADGKPNTGIPPLIKAANQGKEKCVECLLSHGADANIQNSEGNTALHESAAKGNPSITERLLHHGADANIQNGKGNTSLHGALENGHISMTNLLLRHGGCTMW